MNPARKSIVCCSPAMLPPGAGSLDGVPATQLPPDRKKRIAFKKKRDNPRSDRFIEVGTKALRRETDVWGDAAGTAPAVTSVTSLSPSIYFQALALGAPLRRAYSLCAEHASAGAFAPRFLQTPPRDIYVRSRRAGERVMTSIAKVHHH